jgi:ABC-2 type transport system permease protein
MRQFTGFIKKEFYHIFRDKKTLIVLFGMPVIQMILFGFVISNEIKETRIAVLDQSKDAVTEKIIDKINSSTYFVVIDYLNNENQIEGVFKSGKVKEVVVFESDFAKKLERSGKASVNLIADASDANTANLIVSYTSGIINDFNLKNKTSAGMPLQIIQETRMFYNEELRSVFMFVPGTMAMILILISALLTSVSIVREKELNTMEVLLVSPLKTFQIIAGKVIPYIALSLINVFTILLLSVFVFGLPIQGNILLLLAECLLFILLSLSIGIFISTSTDSQQVAMMISLVALMMPAILLSGFIFPIENMPVWLQWICSINPTTYFIIVLKNIMLKGTGFASVFKETMIMCGMILFFILMSIRKFKTRLEK